MKGLSAVTLAAKIAKENETLSIKKQPNKVAHLTPEIPHVWMVSDDTGIITVCTSWEEVTELLCEIS